MNLRVGSQIHNSTDYLLSEGSPRVQRYYRELLGQQGDAEESLQATWGIVPPQSSKPEKKNKCEKWPKLHHDVFKKKGLCWATASTEPAQSTKRYYPGLYGVSAREFDKKYLNDVKYTEKDLRIIEVSQGAGRTDASEDSENLVMGTIYPNGRYCFSSRCRLLLGEEEMRLQSLWFGERIMNDTPNHLLKSLAGNAFETSCCAATTLIGLLLLASQSRHRKSNVPPALAPDPSVHNEDESSDDEESSLVALWGRRKK